MTALWTILGYPPVGVAVPMWVKAGERQPGIMLQSDVPNHALMCDYALALKHRIFSIKRGNGPRYMNFTLIHNSLGTGYMDELSELEKRIFESYREAMEQWRRQGINLQQLNQLNANMETLVKQTYTSFY